jgi:tetratricopeptide (TPR) repeat protein
MVKFSIRPNKSKKTSFLLRVLYCFLWCAAVLFCIYFISYGLSGGQLFTFDHLIIFILCCIPLSIIYALTVEKLGTGLFALLPGWSNKKIPLIEQYTADISKARFSKSMGKYSEALEIINEVLEKIPDFPEAIFLKAQIEWEGFKSGDLARKNLDKALELVKDDEPFRKRVANYYMGMIKGESNVD